MQRASSKLFVLCLVLTVASACTRKDGKYFGATKPKHGPDEAWTNVGAEPEYIDPGKCSDSSGGFIIFNTFAGLTQPDPVTLEARPDVAERWEVSPDGRRYTFHLRPTTWSDGKPLTAHDFVYSWQRVLDPATESKYASFLFPIRNAEAFHEGTLRDVSQLGVRAENDHVLVVDLENPLPYFLDIVKFYTAMPVPRHVLERLKKAGLNTDLWTRPEHIVSNGPYRLAEWKFRQRMVLEKNPRYWDAAKVKLQRVRLSMVESANTTLNLYEAGELDSIGNASLPSELMDHLARYADFTRAPYLGTYFLWVNTKQKPLDDVRVRRALSLAIDRKAMVEHVARGGQMPFADLVPEGLGGYHGPGNPIYDPEQARALLASAGHGPERPLPKIVFTYNTSEGHKQIAEALQQMWKRALGIEVELRNQEWKVYLKTLETGDFQIARMGWIGDYPDPFTFLELLSSQNGNNHSGFAEARYDELLRRGNATLDRQARFAILREAETLAMAQAPVLPIYVYTRSELVKPYLKGHTLNYENRFFFKHWWIDERYYEGVPADDGVGKAASR